MRVSFEFDRDHLQRAIAVTVIALVAVSLAGPAGAQSAANATPVNACTTIDSPGNYVLTGDITNSGVGEEGACIEITASNVVFDGAGHALTGGGSGHGIAVNGSANPVSNVTVENVHAYGWTVGVFAHDTTDGTIRNTVTNDTISGVALAASSGYRIVDNTAYDNAIGIAVGGDSHNNTISRETAVENKWGIHFERESGGNTVRNSVARNNSNWAYYSTRNDAPNTVSGLELSTATVSFTEQNVALRAAPSPPPLPSDTGNLDSYLEATKTSGSAFSLSLTMQYKPKNGASASLWRTTGQGWAPVSGTTTDQSSNTVSANNLTQFGTFGALADSGSGGPVTVTTSQPPSVERTLTTTPGGPTTQSTNSASTNHASTTASGASRSGSNTTAAADTGTRSGSATTNTGTATTRSATPTSNSQSNASQNGTEPTATSGVSGESDVVGLLSNVGGVRLLFAALGIIALVGLGLVFLRQRRNRRGPGGGL